MLIFGAMQIVGSLGDLIIFAGLISLIMPIIVTSMDVSDHRKSGRDSLSTNPIAGCKRPPEIIAG